MASHSWNLQQLPFSSLQSKASVKLRYQRAYGISRKLPCMWNLRTKTKYLCKEQQEEHYVHHAIWQKAQRFSLGFRFRQRPNVNVFITLLNCPAKKVPAEKVSSTLWLNRLYSQLECNPSPHGFPSLFGSWFWPVLGKVLICLQCGKIILFFCHCSGYTHPHMLESWEMAWFRQLSEITEGCLWKWKHLSGNHRKQKLKFQNTSVLICLEKQHYIFHYFLGLLSFLFTNSNNLRFLFWGLEKDKEQSTFSEKDSSSQDIKKSFFRVKENAWSLDFKTCCSESATHLMHTWSLDSTSTVFSNKSPKRSYGLMVHVFRNRVLLRHHPCQKQQ